jgi:hypothetical protein
MGVVGYGEEYTVDMIFNSLCEVYRLFETDPTLG